MIIKYVKLYKRSQAGHKAAPPVQHISVACQHAAGYSSPSHPNQPGQASLARQASVCHILERGL